MPKFRSPSPEEAKKLREYHRLDYSSTRVRTVLRISPKILASWLVELELSPLRKPQTRRTERLATNEAVEFRKYYATMPTQKEVLSVYNISIKTFESWLAQLNLEKHPPHAKPQTTNIRSDELSPRMYRKKNPDYKIVLTPSVNSYCDIPEDPNRESLAAKFRRRGLVALDPHR
jgi:hypothetical protein